MALIGVTVASALEMESDNDYPFTKIIKSL